MPKFYFVSGIAICVMFIYGIFSGWRLFDDSGSNAKIKGASAYHK